MRQGPDRHAGESFSGQQEQELNSSFLRFKNSIYRSKTVDFPSKNAAEILAQVQGNKRLTQLLAGSTFLHNFWLLGGSLLRVFGTFEYVEDSVKA
jgi:hypothetical protein